MTGRRRWVRVALAAAAGLGAAVAPASPASAHTVTGVPATNYRSQITAITPATPSIRVRLLDLGRRVQLTNSGTEDVVVLGYQGEPYLRVGPAGTFENRRSPAVYQNRVTTGPTTETTLPPEADATAPPSWHRTSTGHTVTWRDQRTRWEGPDPVEVSEAPQVTQVVVPRWTIELRRGDAPVLVDGRITWVPSPNGWPWLALAAALAVGGAWLGRLRRWGPALAVAVASAVALDIVRNVGVAVGSAGSAGSVAVAVLLGGMLSVAAWVIGVGAIDALHQQRVGGAMAAGGIGFFLAANAAAEGAVLFRSQVPRAFSATFARAAVAGTIGIGLGLLGAAILVVRRSVDLRAAFNRGRSAAPAPAPAGVRAKPTRPTAK